MSLNDNLRRSEGLSIKNDGSDQCKAKCPECHSKCGNVLGHKNLHRCIKGHTFKRFACPECNTELPDVDENSWHHGRHKCPKCGWQGRAEKTEKMGRVRKPWNDNSSSLVGPHSKPFR